MATVPGPPGDRRLALTITANPAVDVTLRVPELVPAEKLRVTASRAEPGGGGINVARVVTELGGEVTALFPAGGSVGHELEDQVDGRGFTWRSVAVEGATRRNVTVEVEDEAGAHYRFVGPGPEVTDEEWRALVAQVGATDPRPDLVVVSGSFPPGVGPEGMTALAAATRELGAMLVADTSREALDAAVAAKPDLMKPNVRELAQLTGWTGDPREIDHEAAAEQLVEGGVGAVVVSLGPHGAYVVGREVAGTHVEAPDVEVVSTVGAGDSMVAGIVVGLEQGLDLVEAVRLGVAAGSATCTTPGSQLCDRETVERLHAQLRG